jgi:NADPH:quinone reductase-like Zn-dependent oxidoreductase
VEKPEPGEREVLIKVRVVAGLGRPKDRRLGVDVTGRVEAVRKQLQEYRPGGEVFGTCRGAFADYAQTEECALVMKPENVTFEQAAAVPIAALTALQSFSNRDGFGRDRRC